MYKKNHGLGYTIPSQNSAEVQVHIAAAQSGSTSPETDAKKAIAAAEEVASNNTGVDITETAKTLVTQPEEVKQILTTATSSTASTLAVKKTKGINVANARKSTFENYVNQLKNLMTQTGTTSANNLRLIDSLSHNFNSVYNVLMIEARKNGYGTRKYAYEATKLDNFIEEVKSKISELQTLAPTTTTTTASESTSIQSDLENFNFESTVKNDLVKSNFIDSDGNDRTGAPMPETNMNTNVGGMDLKTVLIAAVGALVLLKGGIL